MAWMVRVLLLGLIISGGFSCTTVRGWMPGDRGADSAPAPTADAAPAVEGEDQETAFRKTVQRYIESAQRERLAEEKKIIRRRPYFLKEYSEYPQGSEVFEYEITETESRTAPFVAEADIPKVQYATRLHRERRDAEEDDNFLRHTGTETASFEFRNGRWVRLGSLFVADTSEEKIAGAWTPVTEETAAAAEPDEPQPGIFGRTWNLITGGD
jgi:hypothetical protein